MQSGKYTEEWEIDLMTVVYRAYDMNLAPDDSKYCHELKASTREEALVASKKIETHVRPWVRFSHISEFDGEKCTGSTVLHGADSTWCDVSGDVTYHVAICPAGGWAHPDAMESVDVTSDHPVLYHAYEQFRVYERQSEAGIIARDSRGYRPLTRQECWSLADRYGAPQNYPFMHLEQQQRPADANLQQTGSEPGF